MANIRAARRSGRILRGGRMVRETLWADFTSTLTAIANPQNATMVNVTGAVLLDLRPWTVIRARGMLHLQSDQSAAAEDQAAIWGMCIVSDQAVAIGVTAIPTPVSDGVSDLWFMFQSMMASRGAGTTDSEVGRAWEYDSRAMRKVEDGDQLVTVLESERAALTLGVVVRHSGRILIKLH